MDFSKITMEWSTAIIDFAPKIAGALAMLVIGFWVIKRIVDFTKTIISKNGVDETLSKFLSSIVNAALKVMLLFSIAGIFDVNTTSFIAIISALMVGVGMALNGTLSHIAAGVILMIFKPFKVGDIVEIGGGRNGEVEAINAFNTTLKTLDNKRIIIANSNVTGNDIVNISGQGIIGVELSFGIGYGADIDKARQIIMTVGNSCPYILKDPSQGVVVAELGDSSVNLATRPFCKSEHFWDTKFYMQENVKKGFDAQGIDIPFPTVEVVRSN